MEEPTQEIKVVVVDDEALSREHLVNFLSAEKQIEVVGVCGNRTDAVQRIEETKPDLIFLDAQLAPGDGFDVLNRLRSSPPPITILTTAFEHFAHSKFDSHVFDCLLKPFTQQYFKNSLHRAREHLFGSRSVEFQTLEFHGDVATPLLSGASPGRHHADRLIFKSNNRFVFVRAKEIRWIHAEGNYLQIYAATASHLVRETMTRIEEKLNPEIFLRIHRSTIVNLSYIKEIEPGPPSAGVVVLQDGTKLRTSRGYRERIFELLARGSL